MNYADRRSSANPREPEGVKLSEWVKPEHRNRYVTRGEFLALEVHMAKQRRLSRRFYLWVLRRRSVQWFLVHLMGMKIEPVQPLGIANDHE